MIGKRFLYQPPVSSGISVTRCHGRSESGLDMLQGSLIHRRLLLLGVALILFSCSTDGLVPVAPVESSGSVGAITPLQLEGPVNGNGPVSLQPSLATPQPVSSPQQMSRSTARPSPTRSLPMIDSDGSPPPVAPELEQASQSAEPVTLASAQPAGQDMIAEAGTSQPVVDGIGTDSPKLVAPPVNQSKASDIPITWSDTPVVDSPLQPEEPAEAVTRPAAPRPPEKRLAMIPRMENPVAELPIVDSQVPDSDGRPETGPLSASDIQCRRELQSLGVQFRDLPTISQGPACGIAHPISVTGFDRGRIRFYPTATLNCQVTLQFARWIRNELVPSARLRYWSGVKSIQQMSAYSCRRMNSDSNNPWSEHARGNAIDIGAVTLNNGHKIEIEKKFSFRENGLLKAVRSDSCKYFNTVLGPGSNKYHKDHFHFDLRSHKGGRKYCD
jgi:hypothetical protein